MCEFLQTERVWNKESVWGAECDVRGGVQVVRALQAVLADFFGSKKCRLTRPALESFLRTIPAAAPAVLPDVIAAAAGARTTFLRTEAFVLLSAMLRPPKVRL